MSVLTGFYVAVLSVFLFWAMRQMWDRRQHRRLPWRDESLYTDAHLAERRRRLATLQRPAAKGVERRS